MEGLRRSCVLQKGRQRRTTFVAGVLAAWVFGVSPTALAESEAGSTPGSAVARASYRVVGKSRVEDTPSGLPGPYGDVLVHRLRLEAPIPLYVGEKSAWALRLGYGYNRVRSDAVPFYRSDLQLYRFSLEIGAEFRLHPDWSLAVTLGAALASDLGDSLRGESFQPKGVALATYRVSDTWSIPFGARVGYQLYRVMPVPMVGASFDDGGVFRLDALLPAEVSGTFRVLPGRLELGPALQFDDPVWAVQRKTPLADDRGSRHQLQLMELTAEGFVAAQVAGPLWLRVALGHGVFRRARVAESATERADFRLSASPYLAASLLLRPRL